MACHCGVQNKGEPCSSRGAGDVLLPLFTLHLITILLNVLQTAWRQPSHVCLLACVCVYMRKRRSGGRGQGVCETKSEKGWLLLVCISVHCIHWTWMRECLRTSQGLKFASIYLPLWCRKYCLPRVHPKNEPVVLKWGKEWVLSLSVN